MQETSQLIYSALQSLRAYTSTEPAALLLLTTLDQNVRKVYEYFLDDVPSAQPMLQKALDKALQRAIFLEQKVLDLEHQAEQLQAQTQAAQQRNAESIAQVSQLRSALAQIEAINQQNADSARAWKAKCGDLEESAQRQRDELMRQFQSLKRETDQQKQQIRQMQAEKYQVFAEFQAKIDLQAARCNELKEAAYRDSAAMQAENTRLCTLVASQNAQLKRPEALGRNQHWEAPAPVTAAAHRQGAYTPGKFVRETLSSSDASQLVDDVGSAMRRMRDEQLYIDQQMGRQKLDRRAIDASLAQINARLKRLQGGPSTDESSAQ